jgi:hypothetical protein
MKNMGRNTTINYERVAQAAEEIKNIGLIPSARKVREKLQTGSMSTILKYLQDWELKQLPQTDAVHPKELDSTVSEAISNEIKKQVDELTLEALSKLDDQIEQNSMLLSEIEQLKEMLVNLKADNEKYKLTNAKCLGSLETTQSELQLANEVLNELRAEKETIVKEVAANKAKLESFEIYKDQVERLRSELALTKKSKPQKNYINEYGDDAGKEIVDFTYRLDEEN